MNLPEIHSVLFVEDDPDAQVAVRFALHEMHGIHLRICSTAREALAAAMDYPATVLLLDVMMPEIDGVSMLAGLRQNELHRTTPAIFLTSMADPDDVRYYRSLGAAGVISKPFDPLTLRQQISEILSDGEGADADAPQMSRELGALHRVFERELPQRLDKIRGALARCRCGPLTRVDCAALWSLVEELRNVAAAYGHHRIAAEAMRLEQAAASMVLNPERSISDLLKIEIGLLSFSV